MATAAPFLSSLPLLLDSPIPTTPLFFQSKITFFKNIKLPALPMSRPWKAEVCSLLWISRTSCEFLSVAPILQREFPRVWHFPRWKQWSLQRSAHLPQKLCFCARCQEGQDFSSIQGIDPKSTAQIAAPIVNSSEFKKVPNLGTWYYSSSQLKSHFYEEMESNPFCFLLNKQYERSESMYHVAWQAVYQTRYTCMTTLSLSLAHTHTLSTTESFLTYYRMCLYVSSRIFSIYVCHTDFVSCCAEEMLLERQPFGIAEVFPCLPFHVILCFENNNKQICLTSQAYCLGFTANR